MNQWKIQAKSYIVLVIWIQICINLLTGSSKAYCIESNLAGLEQFAAEWLKSDCSASIWCFGADYTQDSKVDFVDYAGIFSNNKIILTSSPSCNVSICNMSATPKTVEIYAAQQLQEAFATAGFDVAINPSASAAVQIKIGVASDFNLGVASSSEQAYEIRTTSEGNIEIVGNSGPAVLWGVIDFCERVLKVSWPVADSNETMILNGAPQSSIMVNKLCIVEEPDFERRGWLIGDNTSGQGEWYNDSICNWMSHNRSNFKVTGQWMIGDYVRPLLKERGLDPDSSFIHTLFWLVPDSDFNSHPEYFPLIDGVRQCPDNYASVGTQRCLSNSGVKTLVMQKIAQTFASYPEVYFFGIIQNDGGGWCQCASCKAMDGNQVDTGKYSNRMITFINSIARSMKSYYPTKYIGTLAYSATVSPPDVNVEDNVYVYYCPYNRNLMRKLTDTTDSRNAAHLANIQGWLSKASHVGLYEYYFYSGMDFCPYPFSRTLCQEYPELKELGLAGISPETTTPLWPGMRILSYVVPRCLWDSNKSYSQLLPEFCDKLYGPASASMEQYHNLYENTLYDNLDDFQSVDGPALQIFPQLFGTATLNTLDSYLDTAETIVASSGNSNQQYYVNLERTTFEKFKTINVDPATIPGIGPNLLSNPGAESGSTNWTQSIISGTYTLSIATSVAHSGSKSFKIECTGTAGWSRWYQYVPVTTGKKYAGRFWVRAKDGAKGWVWILNGRNILLSYIDSNDQWFQLVLPETEAVSDEIMILLESRGPGTVYFDDTFFAELVPTAHAPSPADSATNVSITSTLSWTTGVYALSHDVYFGTSQVNVTNATRAAPLGVLVSQGQAGATYDPGTLTNNTTYYWRVDEVGNGGTTQGTVWSFTTIKAVPTFVAAGAVTSNTTAITPALPAGIATNDILLLFLETANQAITIPTPNGGTWTAVTNSPQGTGTAGSTTATRLTVFWSRYNGTQGAPTTSDSGDHQAGRIIAIRGVTTSGNPWDVTAGGVEAVSDTSGSIPGATTTVGNTLIVTAIATAKPDSTSATNFSAWTNANLTSITERIDSAQSAGNGGAIGVATGIRATTGAYGNTAVTLASSAYKGMMSIATKP